MYKSFSASSVWDGEGLNTEKFFNFRGIMGLVFSKKEIKEIDNLICSLLKQT